VLPLKIIDHNNIAAAFLSYESGKSAFFAGFLPPNEGEGVKLGYILVSLESPYHIS